MPHMSTYHSGAAHRGCRRSTNPSFRGSLIASGAILFGLLGACGGRTDFYGSEEQAYGVGVAHPVKGGDGDSSVGDGDSPMGDGDTFIPPGSSGGRGGGVGVGDGDGDLRPPIGVGDGDGDLILPPPPPPPPPGDGDGDGDGVFPPMIGDGDGEPLSGCEPDYRSQNNQYCELSYSCDQGYLWTSCWADGGQSYCDCSSEFGWSSILVGASIDVACGTAAEFCAAGTRIDRSTQSCQIDYEDASSNYCSLQQSCVSQGQTAGGVDVGVTSWSNTWCQRNGSEWTCDCSKANDYLSLSFTPSDNGIVACREANSICNSQDFELNGVVQCERSSQSASDNYCDVGLRCYQETVVDNATVAINSWGSAYCERDSDLEWGCYCNGLGFSGGFSIEGSSPWDSCEAAGDMCTRLITGQ